MEDSCFCLIFYRTETLAHVFWLSSSSTELHLKHKEQVTSNFVFFLKEYVKALKA